MNFFQQFFRRPQPLAVRRLNFWIHLWTGIILTLYLVVVGVTGSILVFRAELEIFCGWKPWHKIKATEPFADIATVVGNLRAAYPDVRVISVTAPTEIDPTFVAVVEGHRRIIVACHPSTGQVLGEFPKAAGWLSVVRELHESLLARRTGRILNGIGAAFLLLLSVTGLVVWWPGVRHWKRALAVDVHRRWRRITFDLHSAAGFWTLLIVSFWATSGIYFAWPRQIFRFVNSFSPVITARPPAITVQPESSAGELDLHVLIEHAYAVDPHTRWSGMAFPYGRRAPLEIFMRRGNGVGREYVDTLYFNPYNGQYLATWQYGVNKSLGDWFIWSQIPLHFGTSWGLGIKLVWAAAGLVVPLLSVTGLLMYWNRALRRKWKRLRLRKHRMSAVAVGR
jgi:uncharacterized iron-regulated membrane protein